ncbi:MAG: hypothetical protein AABW58_00270 [Nanoarchaeota archaeon]
MEDQDLRELIRDSISFLTKYKHPKNQMTADLIGYLKSSKNIEMNGALNGLVGRLVFKFTYGGYLVEDKVQFDPTTKARYKVVSYKLKDGFNFDDTVTWFFESLKEKEAAISN